MEIPKVDPFWDDQLVNQGHGGHRHSTPTMPMNAVPGGAHSPYERNLNFATVAVEDGEYGFPKKKTVRDPLSHRIIEKRRRDRMNNCLADLARLLPPSSLRKGRGRIEKTEIVELAIKHLRHLQCHPCPLGDKCEYGVLADNTGGTNSSPTASCSSSSSGYHSSHEDQFRLGFQECLSETMHFLVEQEGLYAGDATCVRLVKHLNSHCETVIRDHLGNQGKIVPGFRRGAESAADFKKVGCSEGSPSSGYHPNGSSSGSDGNGGHDGEGTEPFALPLQNAPQLVSGESRHTSSVLDYEAENSCSSTPLSIETSDVLSSDGKNNNRMLSKPPIPSIICSHSSNNSRIPVNSGSPANGNGRFSDDGSVNSSASTAHRYKFKSNIKQRFTADCQRPEDRFCYSQSNQKSNGAECERDGDTPSDTEDVREERISLLEEAIKSRQSGQEETEPKEMLGTSSRKGSVGANNKHPQQISMSTSPPSLSLNKTAFSSPSPSENESKTSASFSSASLSFIKHLETQRDGEVEIKPSPEELLSAIQNLSSGSHRKPPLMDELSGENGTPAFVLHENGSFYIPLTIDKSIISNYPSKFDSCESPPLYPVTISVCFLLNQEKRKQLDGKLDPEVSNDAPTDFSTSSTISSIPLPVNSYKGDSGLTLKQPSRKGYREGNSSLGSRLGHQRLTSKDTNGFARLSGTGKQHQIPIHHTFLDLGPRYDLLTGSHSNSNQSLHNNNHTGGAAYHPNYQDRSSPCSSGITVLSESRGGESESHSLSGTGGGGGGSSSGSGISRGRKRSVSRSPSVSGGSAGYHSWHDKGSSSSHDFFNFHPNTHTLQALAAQGHLAAVTPVGRSLSPNIGQRHGHGHSQPLTAFHPDNLREKELCYSHDKRSKRARNADQTVEIN